MKRSTAWPAGERGVDDVLCALPAALPLEAARRVLVLAPHPDDECIGCGGLVVALVARGVAVKVVLVTDGSGAGGLPPGAAAVRQSEFLAALAELGVQDHTCLGFADGSLSTTPALFDAVDAEVRQFAPDWIVAPSSADAHRDHRCVAAAARRAARAQACVHRLVEYETWSPLPASHVLDITEHQAVKLAALAQHRTALACGNYVEAARGLAAYRALLLGRAQPGAACEAFLVLDRDSNFAWPIGWGRPR